MAGFLFFKWLEIFIRLRLELHLFVSFAFLKNDHFSGSLHDFNQGFIVLFRQFKPFFQRLIFASQLFNFLFQLIDFFSELFLLIYKVFLNRGFFQLFKVLNNIIERQIFRIAPGNRFDRSRKIRRMDAYFLRSSLRCFFASSIPDWYCFLTKEFQRNPQAAAVLLKALPTSSKAESCVPPSRMCLKTTSASNISSSCVHASCLVIVKCYPPP